MAATGKGEGSGCRRTSARAGSSQTFGREGTSPGAITGADRVGPGTPTRRGRASRSQTRSGAARIRSPRRRAASCGETDCQWYEAVARDKAANELHPIKTPPPRYPVAAEQSGQDGRVLVEFIVATNGTVSEARAVNARTEGPGVGKEGVRTC